MSSLDKLKLRINPQQAIRVNKPVVMAMAFVAVFTILLSVIYAFSDTTPNPNQQDKAVNIKVTTDDKSTANNTSMFSDIPASYSDIAAIRKYSPGGEQLNEIEELHQQLQELKNSYSLLEQQMRDINQDGKPKNRMHDDESAKKSGLTFSGLGSNTEDLLNKGGSGSGRNSLDKNKPDDLVANKQQEDNFAYQAENKQRLAVMKAGVDKDKPDNIYAMHRLTKPFSKYQLNAGTLIPATMITGIDTTVAGPVIAQVRSNLYDTVTGKHLLVPQGAKLIGRFDSRSDLKYGQRRFALVFVRLMFPDGSSILLDDQYAADSLGRGGVDGDVDNHWARVIGASTISTILSVGAAMAGNHNSNDKNYQPNNAQNAAAGVSQAMGNIGSDLTRKAMGIPPTITLPPGYQFNISINKDIVLAPYGAKRN